MPRYRSSLTIDRRQSPRVKKMQGPAAKPGPSSLEHAQVILFASDLVSRPANQCPYKGLKCVHILAVEVTVMKP